MGLDDMLVCEVCWTSSFDPVPNEKDCELKHPHVGEHAQCMFCRLSAQLAEKDAALSELEEMAEEFYAVFTGSKGWINAKEEVSENLRVALRKARAALSPQETK